MKIFLIICVLFLAGCGFNPVSNTHHQDSKFDRFMAQCHEWDMDICLKRYNELAIR